MTKTVTVTNQDYSTTTTDIIIVQPQIYSNEHGWIDEDYKVILQNPTKGLNKADFTLYRGKRLIITEQEGPLSDD